MEFESAKEAAERLGVTVRAVQKWAKDNRIKGAKRLGREWLIPTNASPDTENDGQAEVRHQFMPLLTNSFVPGFCNDLIESFEDEGDRMIATAEYNYYKGNTRKAAEISELYLDHEDLALSLSAGFIYVFANLSSGKHQLVKLGLNNINLRVRQAIEAKNDKTLYAYGVFMESAVLLLLHNTAADSERLSDVMADLPKGLKLFGAYLLAHKAYLDKEYSRGAGIAEGALLAREEAYPVASLYLKIIRTVCLMNLKNPAEAKKSFAEINRIALDEKFYQPFVEHHGLLQGIVEAEIKKSHPEGYIEVVGMVESFSTGWSILHNELTSNNVTVRLTTTEFAVAMLFNRSWSVKEISAHMDISPRMVKHHLAVIYQKLDVSNREELGQYLLK